MYLFEHFFSRRVHVLAFLSKREFVLREMLARGRFRSISNCRNKINNPEVLYSNKTISLLQRCYTWFVTKINRNETRFINYYSRWLSISKLKWRCFIENKQYIIVRRRGIRRNMVQHVTALVMDGSVNGHYWMDGHWMDGHRMNGHWMDGHWMNDGCRHYYAGSGGWVRLHDCGRMDHRGRMLYDGRYDGHEWRSVRESQRVQHKCDLKLIKTQYR